MTLSDEFNFIKYRQVIKTNVRNSKPFFDADIGLDYGILLDYKYFPKNMYNLYSANFLAFKGIESIEDINQFNLHYLAYTKNRTILITSETTRSELLINHSLPMFYLISKCFPVKHKYFAIETERSLLTNDNIFYGDAIGKDETVYVIGDILDPSTMEFLRSKYNVKFIFRRKMNSDPKSSEIMNYYNLADNPEWVTRCFLAKDIPEAFTALKEEMPSKAEEYAIMTLKMGNKVIENKIKLPTLCPLIS